MSAGFALLLQGKRRGRALARTRFVCDSPVGGVCHGVVTDLDLNLPNKMLIGHRIRPQRRSPGDGTLFEPRWKKELAFDLDVRFVPPGVGIYSGPSSDPGTLFSGGGGVVGGLDLQCLTSPRLLFCVNKREGDVGGATVSALTPKAPSDLVLGSDLRCTSALLLLPPLISNLYRE